MTGAATKHTLRLAETGREIVDGPKIVTSGAGVVTEITGQGEKTPETVLGGGEMVLLTRNQRAVEMTAGIVACGKTLVLRRGR